MNGYLSGYEAKKNSPMTLDDLSAYSGAAINSTHDGDKFLGGFGATELHNIDYWTLRARSSQLFNNNLYARGLIRRLITNEINTGLTPEAAPDEKIIGVADDSLNEWTEDIETRFDLWHKNPELCDYSERMTFGEIQRTARREALVCGDVLVVMRQSKTTKLPTIQLISGDKVQSPFEYDIAKGHYLEHGVEFNARKKIVAHWIKQDDGEMRRLPAFGRSGRKISWLVFGTDKRLDEVRGQPLLSIILQSLREIDRYRDSVQRKAVVNSILAMYIQKTQDKPSSLPVSGGATRRGTVQTQDYDGAQREFKIADQIPGVVMEELQHGEEPKGFGNNGTDEAFGVFEQAVLSAVAWANEMPPEILTLSFSSNYSASQAAVNEFKIYLNRIWSEFGEQFCNPIYIDWMLSEALLGKIQANTLLESWRNPLKYDVFGAWVNVDWYGSIKPSIDLLKQGRGSELLVINGWSTNARESRVITGTKFSRNMKRIKQENQLKIAALRPMAEFKKEFGEQVVDDAVEAKNNEEITALVDGLKEALDDAGHDSDFVDGFFEALENEG